MQCQIVLVMRFGWIKLLQRHDLDDDGCGKPAPGSELPDMALRVVLLLSADVENRRAVRGLLCHLAFGHGVALHGMLREEVAAAKQKTDGDKGWLVASAGIPVR